MNIWLAIRARIRVARWADRVAEPIVAEPDVDLMICQLARMQWYRYGHSTHIVATIGVHAAAQGMIASALVRAARL